MLLSPSKSLIRTTLIKMAIRIILVFAAVTMISYWLITSNLKQYTLTHLSDYTHERGQRESERFMRAEQNHIQLRRDFLDRLDAIGEHDPVGYFNTLFEPWDDGTIRLKPEYFYGIQQENGRQINSLTGFIGKNKTVTQTDRQRLVIIYDLLRMYGPAWQGYFTNIYISLHNNMGVLFWPGVPWDLEVSSDFDMTEGEWFYLADPAHNPSRKTIWTGLYYDDVAGTWMVSVLTPVDIEGQHIATIGCDVLLNDLIHRTTQNGQGQYHLIFRTDGQLIAHPKYSKQLQDQTDVINLTEMSDPNLMRTFQQIIASDPGQVIIYNNEDGQYLATTRIQGPGWIFVTVYPEELITNAALTIAHILLLLGLAALIIEIGLVFMVLRQHVIEPLREFVTVTDHVANGQFDLKQIPPLPIQRHDEIGRLATAFAHMTRRLQASFNQIQNSEQRYYQLFENSYDTIVVTKPDGRIVDINAAGERLFGYDRVDLLSMTAQDLYVDPAEREIFRQKIEQDGLVANFETQLQHKDGSTCDVILSAVLQSEPDKKTALFQTIIHDFSERKQHEQDITRALGEKETLLRELYHRTKNNMQVIRSMLVLQAAHSPHPEVKKLVQETGNRIQAMALVHQNLYQTQDLSWIDLRSYFKNLSRLLMKSFSPTSAKIKLTLNLEEVHALIDTAIPCGLVINELMSNSLQHGFPDDMEGEIRLDLHKEADSRVVLYYVDTGVGVPDDFDFYKQETLGIQTIIALVVHQLQGTIQFESKNGLAVRIQYKDNLYKKRL